MREFTVGRSVEIETLQLEWLTSTELRLAGTLSSPTALTEFGKQLDLLHAYITNGALPSFTVDMRSLNFVNSSVIRVFVTWISRAERAGYKLVFLTDRSITWHRLSFSVLKSLAPNTVELVEARRESHAGGPG